MTVQECGMSDVVLHTLAQHLDRATDDIKVGFIILYD
jgi:histone-lysine N-methyltransferase EZH2